PIPCPNDTITTWPSGDTEKTGGTDAVISLGVICARVSSASISRFQLEPALSTIDPANVPTSQPRPVSGGGAARVAAGPLWGARRAGAVGPPGCRHAPPHAYLAPR